MAQLTSLKSSMDTGTVEYGFSNTAFQWDQSDPQSLQHCKSTANGSTDGRIVQKQKTNNRREKLRILKNVIFISIAFMLLFTAFQSMANLQSSINRVEGLGTYSLSTVYGALVVSCIFIPTFLIKKLTCKWALVVSMFAYSFYIAAQFYPQFYTLIPGAIILGFGAAPMWSAKCTYLTHIGNVYADMIGETVEPIIVRFFGIFFLAFQTSQIWGNLISSVVLGQGLNENDTTSDPEVLAKCGANFCPEPESNMTDNLQPPDKSKIYTIATIYLICALLSAALVAIFVDPLTRYGEKEREGSASKLSGWHLLIATINHMKKPYQILIIPLTMWSGFEQGYISADFTQAFVSCAWGIHQVGYVMICYGVLDALCSISFGAIIKIFGRIPIFVFGAMVNVMMIITMLLWQPNPDDSIVFFVIAGSWGIADAIWQTQINAFYGVIFPADEEAAFSNYRLWESIGFIIAYAYGNLICVSVKLYILLGVLGVSMGGYFVLEYLEYRKKHQQ